LFLENANCDLSRYAHIYAHTYKGQLTMRRLTTNPRKRATNVSLDADLLSEAKELGVNISRACDRGLALQIAEERGKRWLEENKAAIESSNDYVERHGVPLARHRRF
jgi:antitoxin CcdA